MDIADMVTEVPRDVQTPPPMRLGERLSVLVLSPRFVAAYLLPDEGQVTIGRSKSVELYVDDPSVSRRHAILTVEGATLTVHDLGSSNGTRCHGARLEPHVPVSVTVGEALVVGRTTTLLVQRRPVALPPRRFWSHEDFEVRLEEECARTGRTGGHFALATLHVDRQAPDVGVRQILAGMLRSFDVVGECGPSEYEVLVMDASKRDASIVLERVMRGFEERKVSARSCLVVFPEDGANAGDLLGKAQSMGRERRSLLPVPRHAVVADEGMRELYGLAEKFALGDLPILLLGETGVGKEVMAEEIHRLSRRARGPFLRLNCAALSETLLESELFGHERGSFTNAVAAKPGLLETAEHGTVFLDEIGELPMSLQVKLLRVLEEKQMYRVGAVKPRPLDVRFVAATNRDLEVQVARSAFREDLFYRLAGATLKLPPLRERLADLEPLAHMLLAAASAPLGVTPGGFSPESMELLRAYRWPGNIRELRHVIERAVLVCGEGPILPVHLPAAIRVGGDDRAIDTLRRGAGSTTPAIEPIEGEEEEERARILEVLSSCGGNQSRAARILGMSRGALIRRLERYGVIRPRKEN